MCGIFLRNDEMKILRLGRGDRKGHSNIISTLPSTSQFYVSSSNDEYA